MGTRGGGLVRWEFSINKWWRKADGCPLLPLLLGGLMNLKKKLSVHVMVLGTEHVQRMQLFLQCNSHNIINHLLTV